MYACRGPPSFDAVTIHQCCISPTSGARHRRSPRCAPGPGACDSDFAPHDLDHLRREHAHRRLALPRPRSWMVRDPASSPSRRPPPRQTADGRLWAADRPAVSMGHGANFTSPEGKVASGSERVRGSPSAALSRPTLIRFSRGPSPQPSSLRRGSTPPLRRGAPPFQLERHSCLTVSWRRQGEHSESLVRILPPKTEEMEKALWQAVKRWSR